MKFFFLAHSVSSLICLKKLIEKNCKPELVIIHKEYEKEKLLKDFYKPIKNLCSLKKIKLVQSDNLSEIKESIKAFDVGICVGYMNILKKDFFGIPKYGIFNLHCGKLPKYRGRAPICRTIMNGDNDLIMTLHKMDEGVDSGDIAVEKKIKITLKDDVNSVYKKFSGNSYKAVIELLRSLEKRNLKLRKQRISASARPNKKLTEAECKIDWNRNQKEVFNKIRALKFPYPGAFSNINKQKYIFLDSRMTNTKSSCKSGSVVKVNRANVSVKTKDYSIEISEIYKYGKKVSMSKEFKIGEQFN